MNNEFEKNAENRDINDNTSEFINDIQAEDQFSDTENKTETAVSEIAEQQPETNDTNSFPEDVQSIGDTCEVACDISDVTQDESTTETEATLAEKYESEDTQSSKVPVETHREENSCIPGTKTYLYSKSGNGDGNTVGCVWEDASTPEKEKNKKNKLSGFKVFTAAMLAVFTLSAVSIAGFLAYDFAKDSASETKSANGYTSQPAPSVSSSVYEGQTTLISTFTDSENGLTKSQVATKCSPSAVGIVIEQEQNYSGYSFPFGFGYDFNIPGGTQIVQGSGSGFIFSTDGYIITNHHVINGASKITVYLYDGSTAEAKLIGSDALSDIAVIKIDATDKNLVPMEIGDSTLMKVGDEVIAIGCPAGIEFMGTVTDGIISAINRDVELDNDGSSTTKTMTLLQTNATINRGNSGGPLINTKGQVIGINTLKLSADYEGIGFSIPMSGALPIINQLIEHGEVVERSESFVSSEGIIGISASEITKQESEYYDIPTGVLVVQIDKDSSASKAGLRRGDIITKFNGEEVTTVNQLNKLKAAFKAGDEVTLTVYRELNDSDDTFDITFKLDMAE